MRCVSFLLLTAALSACASAPQPRSARAEEHLQSLLAGKTPGKPVDCLPTYRSGDMVVIDDNTIVFRDGRRVWRNDLNGGTCNSLGSGHYALVTHTFGGTGLCRGDIATVADLQSGMTVGSCVIGDFVPYTKVG